MLGQLRRYGRVLTVAATVAACTVPMAALRTAAGNFSCSVLRVGRASKASEARHPSTDAANAAEARACN